ncbi:DUF3932 family protein [Bacillus sp. 165]|uniref:DUF3932 family protein n=1 Tax=Bacillus sp. 165 TaxID=1529117 RepID=UPI001ADAB75F|nr:DUF3932 family protein [Bacillus sp. 165]MBO9129753.1 DUF3932 family protein [Bacillus sp. 165]
MKEMFRLQTTPHSSFDRLLQSIATDTPIPVQWSTLKEVIKEYMSSHPIHCLPDYISSSLSYYVQRICTNGNAEIIVYTKAHQI